MSPRPDTVGLAIIARDEEATLPRLLESVSGCFDQVALLDTGSTDRTVELFETWAAAERDRHPGFTARTGRFAWCDDFGAARTAADALLDTDWHVWADADDEVRGASALRRLAATAPADIAAFVAGYETSHTVAGHVESYAQRVRMVRSGRGRWQNPVHEQITVDGQLAGIDPRTTLWIHRKPAGRDAGGARNRAILLRWLEREPDNPRALEHCGREAALADDHDAAVAHFRAWIARSVCWGDERARMHRQLGLSLLALGRADDAADDAALVAATLPEHPDAQLTLAEAALAAGDHAAAIRHAQRVLELGAPRSALLHVATDYTVRPRALIAQALQAGGDAAQARAAAEAALLALGGTGAAPD